MEALETFRPRNLEKRQKHHVAMRAKKLRDYELFVINFQQNLLALQDVEVDDVKERLLVDLMKETR